LQDQKPKKDTVLIWFDDGSYTYIHLGICYALSKIAEVNFVGIATTKQDMGFLKTQKFIKFEKLFYYPDCYQEKISYSLANLKKFEKEYDLDIWLNIFMDRFFYKFYTHFHHFKKEEILPIVENSVKFFVDIFKEYDPKLVLLQSAGENFADFLLYKLAKKMNVKISMTNIIHLHNKIVISDNLISREISKEYEKIISNQKNINDEFNKNLIKNQSAFETIKIQSNFNFNNSNIFDKIKHYTKRFFYEPETIYQNKGKSKSKMLQFRYQNYFEIKKRNKFLNKNSSKFIKNEKFFYFPLQTEPEAKPSVTAPFFIDQLNLIENIARSMPVDFLLYVKEHPMQKLKFWRSVQDYQRIINIPNVKLIHPSIYSQDLISKSQGVMATSGSTAFEALFFEKPVFLFADDYYDVVSMVNRVHDISKLPKIIKNTLENFRFKNDELNAIIQATKNISIPIRYSDIMNNAIILSSIQRNKSKSKNVIKYFEKFFRDYETDFELLAKTIDKKM